MKGETSLGDLLNSLTGVNESGSDSMNEESPDVLSDDAMPYIYVINLSICCGVISIFGMVTNSINITVFLRQGFKETINISLFALAIADLCSLIALLFVSVCYNPLFMYSGLPILTTELQHFIGAWTHIVFMRITGLITVFITFERCLCITFPLKVKGILNPFRVTIIIVSIYLFVLCNLVPNYFGAALGWKFVPRLNRTVIGNINYDPNSILVQFSHALQPFYPVFSFTTVVVCSYILIRQLNQRSKWRNTTAAAGGQNDQKSLVRDRQVVKMVVYVAIIFIVTYTPSLALFICMLIMPDFNMGYRLQNSFILTYSISFAFEAINSSLNIFVYYRTSSNYKHHFRSLFFKGEQVSAKGSVS